MSLASPVSNASRSSTTWRRSPFDWKVNKYAKPSSSAPRPALASTPSPRGTKLLRSVSTIFATPTKTVINLLGYDIEKFHQLRIFVSILRRVFISLTFIGTVGCNVAAFLLWENGYLTQSFSEIPSDCYGILLGFLIAYRAQAAIERLYDAKRLVVSIRLYVLEIWNSSQTLFLNKEFDSQDGGTADAKKAFVNLHNEFMPFLMYMFRQLQILSCDSGGEKARQTWDTRLQSAMARGIPIRDLPDAFYHAGQAFTGDEKMHLIYASLAYKMQKYLPDELPKLRKILKAYQECLVLCCSVKMEGTRFLGIFSEICACALCWLLPFIIIGSFGYLMPIWSLFVTFAFKTLIAFAQQAESPFGSARFDVDLFQEVLDAREELEESASRLRQVINLNRLDAFLEPTRFAPNRYSVTATGSSLDVGEDGTCRMAASTSLVAPLPTSSHPLLTASMMSDATSRVSEQGDNPRRARKLFSSANLVPVPMRRVNSLPRTSDAMSVSSDGADAAPIFCHKSPIFLDSNESPSVADRGDLERSHIPEKKLEGLHLPSAIIERRDNESSAEYGTGGA